MYHRVRGKSVTASGDGESLWRGRTAWNRGPTITAIMRQGRRRLRDRFGLQARMTASYVLVTAAAVILVEAIAIGVLIPSLLSNQDLTSRVATTAGNLSEQVALVSTSTDHVVLPPNYSLGQPTSFVGPGKVKDSGNGLLVPQITDTLPGPVDALTLALLFSPDGKVLASSYPARYPVGSSAYAVIPNGAAYDQGGKGTISPAISGNVAWSVQPVLLDVYHANPLLPPGTQKSPPDAFVYVQAPVQPATIASLSSARPLLQIGFILLLVTLPFGVLFGVLTTRGVVHRLQRLGVTTARLADGDLSQRVTPGNSDEVGHLERDFNNMAQRLQVAVGQERMLAEKSARLAERSRISRELHDSISQDLFSLSLLASGLEKALPEESPVRNEVRALAETVQSANREMRALLLELRPTTLEEKGLVPALHELVSTYADRLGIKVDADVEPVAMAPAVELAALRIAQEGLANAVRHAQAQTIRLSLHRKGAGAQMMVADDGRGFDPALNGSGPGLGLRLMRERVEELGGTLSIRSTAGEGTVVTATLPA